MSRRHLTWMTRRRVQLLNKFQLGLGMVVDVVPFFLCILRFSDCLIVLIS